MYSQIREMDLSEKIRLIRGKRTLAEFAGILGTTHQNIQRYEHGTKPYPEFLSSLRKVLSINLNWLFDDTAPMYENEISGMLTEKYGKHLRRIPEIAFADCGLPAAQWEQCEKDFVVVSGLKNYKNLFAFRAQGDSMTPYINKGDLLVCAEVPFENIKDHTAIIILYKSGPETIEASLKLFARSKIDKNYISVYSVNTKHPPREVNLNTVDKIYKLVRIVREVA